MIKLLTILACTFILGLSLNLYPNPKKVIQLDGTLKLDSLCRLKLKIGNDINFDTEYYFEKVFQRWNRQNEHCPKARLLKTGVSDITVSINMKDSVKK